MILSEAWKLSTSRWNKRFSCIQTVLTPTSRRIFQTWLSRNRGESERRAIHSMYLVHTTVEQSRRDMSERSRLDLCLKDSDEILPKYLVISTTRYFGMYLVHTTVKSRRYMSERSRRRDISEVSSMRSVGKIFQRISTRYFQSRHLFVSCVPPLGWRNSAGKFMTGGVLSYHPCVILSPPFDTVYQGTGIV